MTRRCSRAVLLLVLGNVLFLVSGDSGSLHEAAASGNLALVQQHIAQLPESERSTALQACYKPSGSSSCGAACSILGSSSGNCMSVLQAAALGRQAAVVKYLVNEAGANVDWQDSAGQTALHYAFNSFTVSWHPCSQDFRETVEALLALGADPNIPFKYGPLTEYTVLHFEAYDGNRHALIPALLKAGANVNAVDDRGYTPLHAAASCDFRASCDDCGCSNDICEGSPSKASCPATVDDYSETLQFFGAAPTLRYLVAKGGNASAVGKDGVTVIDRVPIPSDPSAAEWGSGYCKDTYTYLRSLGLKSSKDNSS